MAPAVRAAADRRWRDVLICEWGVRQRATQLRDDYLARAALRSWVAAVVDREPAERGMAFVVDRFEAEAMAGGPPSDEDLAPYRAAADAVAQRLVFVPADQVREATSDKQVVRVTRSHAESRRKRLLSRLWNIRVR